MADNGAYLIDLQIMWNRLIAVVEEQAQVLLRTAFSPIVRECGDLSAGVFDLRGRMLAQAVTGTPGHLNDFVVTTPCFKDGRVVALFSCTSHLMDIGGIGFGPDATDVFMEGLYIPFLKLFEEGRPNETLFAMIRANTRLPIDTIGDVYSLTACNDVGCRRLIEMMSEFDLEDLDLLAGHI